MTQLTELCSTGGCAAKYDAPMLEMLLDALPQTSSPDLLVGLDPPDDAAVIRLDDESALVFTVDFFPPIVDDPTDYGRIAANNALNDVYAMGGQPTLALSIAALPTDLGADLAANIVSGAALQCAEAGVVLAGGHTIRDKEPKFGLAVAGLVSPDRIWRKSGAVPGDVILVTKPIGAGILVTGRRRKVVSDENFDNAVRWMLASNKAVAKILKGHRPHAVTDVTGFGLAGHASEIARLSEVRVTLDMGRIPLLDGVHDCASDGIQTSAHSANMALVDDLLTSDSTVDDTALALALDPQTAGGLMIVVPPDIADVITDEIRKDDLFAVQVGHIDEGSGVHLVGQV